MSARAPLFVVFAAIAAMLAVGATSPAEAQQAAGQGVTAALLQPLDASDTPEAYARNRRIELRLTDR